MVTIPVYCANCGALFGSRGFNIGNVRNLTLQGNKETCIRCGKLAHLVNGVFDASEGVLKLIQGPQLTVEILKAFSALLDQAQQNKITPDELQSEAEKLDPKLGEAVSAIQAKAGILPVVILLLLAALQTCEFKLDATIDLNQLVDQAFHAVEQSSSVPSKNDGHGEDATDNEKSSTGNATSDDAASKNP